MTDSERPVEQRESCQAASFRWQSAQKPAARKQRFAQPFQRDLGRPAALSKIFRLTCRPNQFYQFARLVPARGAYRDRHERGMGCGGRESAGARMESQGRSILWVKSGAQDEGRFTRTAKPCGP